MNMKITVPAGVLRDMLNGSLTCTSTDMTTPALCAVGIMVMDGVLRMRSTDRYRAIFSTYEIPAELRTPDHFTVMVDRKEIKSLLAGLPKGKGTSVISVQIAVGDNFVTFDWASGGYIVPIRAGLIPEVDKLVPNEDMPQSVDGLSFSGEYLATLGSVPNPDNAPWRLFFYGASKPMVARRAGNIEWVFLLMPVRIH
jgi:DNA polymerase III sliding clamp (beta) subunit (PCNA family)